LINFSPKPVKRRRANKYGHRFTPNINFNQYDNSNNSGETQEKVDQKDERMDDDQIII